MTNKPIKVLIMSVGPCEKNGSVAYFKRIGGSEHCVVCLPMQFEQHAQSYRDEGVEVYLYDERKYINKDFEYFGFKPRNCGGVGRQGIAEATEHYGDEYLCLQVDDDTSRFAVRRDDFNTKVITKWSTLEAIIYALDEFACGTGIDLSAMTGATKVFKADGFISNKKIFNNFIMRKGNDLNFWGFAALCSDDCRYNAFRNVIQCTPMVSTNRCSIMFTDNQGDRDDGNAPLYNGDCSWKKAYALHMMLPWCAPMHISKEANRVLFREYIEQSKLYPPIMLEDKNGKITKYI